MSMLSACGAQSVKHEMRVMLQARARLQRHLQGAGAWVLHHARLYVLVLSPNPTRQRAALIPRPRPRP
eukprot:386669-Rhodomonas_salina.1